MIYAERSESRGCAEVLGLTRLARFAAQTKAIATGDSTTEITDDNREDIERDHQRENDQENDLGPK